MKKIHSNFLVISQFNRNLSWVPEYTDNYLIYDRSNDPNYELPATIDKNKVRKAPNLGYNSYDYFTYIIDNYENLPDVVIFAKAWTWPRHVTKEFFDRVMNNKTLTPLTDYRMHADRWPYGFFSPEGLVCELNTDIFLSHPDRPTKYVHGFNDFLRFCFKEPLIPRYRMFAPGGDYIVPKEHILKLPKVVYENLRLFMSHDKHAGETHIIERAMMILWTGNFELSENILKKLNVDFPGVPRYEQHKVPVSKKLYRILSAKVARILRAIAFRLETKSVDIK
ncbi:MAG TPA: DUF3431 domain-containing protein [Candidatus Paceibacterota bacterium]|nr:DUF3431 domain-containing protein [Candidatus Paceibacterota bacterium]